MEAIVIIEKGQDGTFDVRTSDEMSVDYMILGQGNTVEEAKKDFYSCYEEMKDVYKEQGLDFQEITSFKFQYDTASFLQYYSKILSLAGLERLTGVNQGQLSHYLTGRRKPSQKTIDKIQTNIHNFGKELQQLHLV
jgi:hypothetical protein